MFTPERSRVVALTSHGWRAAPKSNAQDALKRYRFA